MSTTQKYINPYYDSDSVANATELGQHRGKVGGLWDEMGHLQFDYLCRNGLSPEKRLIDIGCGCLRGGVHFIDYLDPGNYYGVDLSQALLDAGYDIELDRLGLQDKLPRTNLRCIDRLEFADFGVTFDTALAVSLFTHLPINHIRFCLARLAPFVHPGGKFFATFFVVPEGSDWTKALDHDPGGITTYPESDPYHYTREDLDYVCAGLPWRLLRLEDWNHPRDQIMAVFERQELNR